MTDRKTAREKAHETVGYYATWIHVLDPCEMRAVMDSAIDAAIAEARDGALEQAARLADNAATITFAETMSRNAGTDVAQRLAKTIRALKRGEEGGK